MIAFQDGSSAVLYLNDPKEKIWGLVVSVSAAGVVIRGLRLDSFEDWMRQEARQDIETILRRLRGLAPDSPNDFQLTSPDQIIAVFNQVGNAIGAATVALAGISLFIGAIGIGNVMVISVTERQAYIGRVRALAKECAQAWIESPQGMTLGAGMSGMGR